MDIHSNKSRYPGSHIERSENMYIGKNEIVESYAINNGPDENTLHDLSSGSTGMNSGSIINFELQPLTKDNPEHPKMSKISVREVYPMRVGPEYFKIKGICKLELYNVISDIEYSFNAYYNVEFRAGVIIFEDIESASLL